MTKDEKIEWLSRFGETAAEIDRLKLKRERVRAGGEKMTVSYEGLPRSGRDPYADKVGNAAVNAAAIDARIRELLCELVSIRLELWDALYALDGDELRRVLYLRYIQRDGWQDIAAKMDITREWAHRLHNRALEALKPESSLEKRRNPPPWETKKT